MTFEKKINFGWALAALVFLGLLIVYGYFDPGEHDFFPTCPFYALTDLKCPGCGSQRAIHHLLRLEVLQALDSNALLVVALPYIVLGICFDYLGWKDKYPSWRHFLFGKKSVILILAVVLVFFVIRNIIGL